VSHFRGVSTFFYPDGVLMKCPTVLVYSRDKKEGFPKYGCDALKFLKSVRTADFENYFVERCACEYDGSSCADSARNFKIRLGDKLTENGMNPKTLVADFLRLFFKDIATNFAQKDIAHKQLTDYRSIKYCITMPAIWSDSWKWKVCR
jgi:hypothetical protein